MPSLIRLVAGGLRTVLRAVEARRGQRFRVRAVRLKAGRKGHEWDEDYPLIAVICTRKFTGQNGVAEGTNPV